MIVTEVEVDYGWVPAGPDLTSSPGVAERTVLNGHEYWIIGRQQWRSLQLSGGIACHLHRDGIGTERGRKRHPQYTKDVY